MLKLCVWTMIMCHTLWCAVYCVEEDDYDGYISNDVKCFTELYGPWLTSSYLWQYPSLLKSCWCTLGEYDSGDDLLLWLMGIKYSLACHKHCSLNLIVTSLWTIMYGPYLQWCNNWQMAVLIGGLCHVLICSNQNELCLWLSQHGTMKVRG